MSHSESDFVNNSPRPWRLPLRPKLGRVLFLLIALVSLMEFVRSGLYGAYLPQITSQLMGIPKHDAVVFSSSAMSAHFVADVITRGPLGALLNRVGVRPILLAGVLLSLLATIIMMNSNVGWMLLLAAALHGIGSSTIWPAMMSMAAEASLPSHQGRVVTAVTLSTIPAIAGGPVFMLEMAHNWPIQQVFTLCYGLLIAGMLVIMLLPRGLKLRASLASAPAPTDVTAVSGDLPTSTANKVSNWLMLLPMLPAAMLQTMTLSLLGPLIFLIYPEMNLDRHQVILVLAIGAACSAAVFPFTGKLADRGFARENLTLGFGLIAVALGFVATLPPLWGLMLLAGLVGIGYALIMPGWSALVVKILPEKQRPAAWGVLMAAESVGVAVGAPLGAYAYRMGGTAGPFMLSASLALLAAVGYLLLRKKLVPRH